MLLIILGIGYVAAGVVMIFAQGAPLGGTIALLGLGLFFLLLASGQLYAGTSVRKLESAGRTIVTVFSAIGLLGFPIGTLISVYILYLLWGEKGQFIFTPEYRRVIQATPHIRYKTSIVVWILLGLVLFLIAAAIVATVFRPA